jgi:hypothetical protein
MLVAELGADGNPARLFAERWDLRRSAAQRGPMVPETKSRSSVQWQQRSG